MHANFNNHIRGIFISFRMLIYYSSQRNYAQRVISFQEKVSTEKMVGFDPLLRQGVVSLSKTFRPGYLVLVKPRRPPQNDGKIVDRNIKPQTNKQTNNKKRVLLFLYIFNISYVKILFFS